MNKLNKSDTGISKGKELITSEVRYRRLFESAKEGILILDAETGMIVDVNPFLVELLGYSKDQLIDKAIWEIGFLKDVVANREKFLELQKEEYIRYEDLPLETIGGKKIQVEFVNNLYLVNHHKVIQCFIRDITERKKIEDALLKSYKQYEFLIKNTNESIIIVQDDFLKFINPKAVGLTGYTSKELLSKSFLDFIYSEDRMFVGTNNKMRLNGEKVSKHYKFRILTKDNQIRWVDISTILIDWQGKPATLNFLSDITARIQSEEALIDSEMRYRHLFESAKDGILILDAETGMIVDVNPFLIELLDYSKGQFINKAIWEIGSFKDIVANKDKFLQLQNEEYVRYEDLPLETADGREIHVEFISNVYLENHDKVIQCNIRDITEQKKLQKKSEKNLRDNESKFRSYVDNAPHGIFIADELGNYIDVNPAACKITGYSRDELLSMNLIELIPEESLEMAAANFKKVSEEGFLSYEFAFIKKDRSIGFWSLDAVKLPNDKILGYVVDITEQKQAEEALKESEERYSSIVNSSPNIILIHENGIITFVNKIGEKVLGYSIEEIIGKSVLDLPTKESKPIVIANMERRNNGEDIPAYKADIITKSGSIVSVIIQVTKILHQKEKSFLVVLTDISELKEYERELKLSKDKAEEMNRLKSSFLANMSHELRTPMIGILGFSKLLFRSNDPGIKETGEIIYNSGKRLMDTLNQILDLSRIEAGESKVEISDVDLIEDTRETVNLYQAASKEKNLLLSFNTRYDHIYIKTDKKVIVGILNNLINNAVKYTYNGNINVTVNKEKRANDEWAIIEVKDTGIGIEEKNINMVFREFRQASEGLERSFDGIGLGLTLTKKYIELIGGTISVTSKINEGSTFKVSFPLVPVLFENDESLPDEVKVKKEKHKNDKAKKNILIVEDDKLTIIFVQRILKDKYNLDTSLNAMDAIEKAEKKQYDLILMDINLGRSRNGIFTTKEIRKMERYKDTPIIAMTAYAMKGDKEEFLAGGCSHYISKPFDAEDLIEMMQEALGKFV
jgi:PAS domain S-box-containing protein